MYPFIRIHIVIFASLHFVHTHTSRSSFFKISLQKDLQTEKDVFITKSVRDGFHCALTCNTNSERHFAVFDKDLKKCSLLKENATEPPNHSWVRDRKREETISRKGTFFVA